RKRLVLGNVLPTTRCLTFTARLFINQAKSFPRSLRARAYGPYEDSIRRSAFFSFRLVHQKGDFPLVHDLIPAVYSPVVACLLWSRCRSMLMGSRSREVDFVGFNHASS